MNIADLKLDSNDGMGAAVVAIYALNPPDYAVYRSDIRVMVHFSDDRIANALQRKALAPLNPVRGEINGLIDGWRSKPDGTVLQRKAQRYDRRVGDALIVALEGDVPGASVILGMIKQDILNERVAWARFEYLISAFAIGLTVMTAILATTAVTKPEHEALDLWRAAAAGAVGAFFSIALAIRSRTVLPDLQRVGNIMDAILRMTIGTIAASVLMALMMSGAFDLTVGGAKLGDPAGKAWLAVLIAGFIGGFSERLVPDLLAKASASVDDRETTRREQVGKAVPPPETSTAAAAAQPQVESDPLPHESETDACACGLEPTDEEATADDQLPTASGGVETPR